jgi:hypothetical protein
MSARFRRCNRLPTSPNHQLDLPSAAPRPGGINFNDALNFESKTTSYSGTEICSARGCLALAGAVLTLGLSLFVLAIISSLVSPGLTHFSKPP